jgi:hypothetical protein
MPKTAALRRPTPAQNRLLADLEVGGGVNVRRCDIERQHQHATWIAIVDAGWATVNRGTPDNQGGQVPEYRYTVTDEGRTVVARLVGGTDV